MIISGFFCFLEKNISTKKNLGKKIWGFFFCRKFWNSTNFTKFVGNVILSRVFNIKITHLLSIRTVMLRRSSHEFYNIMNSGGLECLNETTATQLQEG
jgi:hypothetical protein